MVLEYDAMEAGLSLAPLSLSMFAVAMLAGKKAGSRSPSGIIRTGFLLLVVGVAVLIPIVPRAHSGYAMIVPLLIAGAGLGLLVSQLNNYTLSPIEEERVSEAAGVNSAGGSFGLSFGLAFAGAIMLASLSLLFTHYADASNVLSARPAEAGRDSAGAERRGDDEHRPRGAPQGQAARGAGGDLAHQHDRETESAADRPVRFPLAALLGLLQGFRMTRLPDPEPSGAGEGMLLG